MAGGGGGAGGRGGRAGGGWWQAGSGWRAGGGGGWGGGYQEALRAGDAGDAGDRAPGPGGVRAATLYDVARAAGVSTATVSRVIHGSDPVRPDTRRRVL